MSLDLNLLRNQTNSGVYHQSNLPPEKHKSLLPNKKQQNEYRRIIDGIAFDEPINDHQCDLKNHQAEHKSNKGHKMIPQ